MPRLIGAAPTRKRAAIEVRAWIRDGRLSRGEILPPEQAMCEELKVSRGTLRAALKDLENEGVLQVRPGRGRVVAMAPAANDQSIQSRTVAMITHLTSEPAPQYFGGDLGAVESGVVDTARRNGLHVLLMHLEGSIASDLARLVSSAPLGLLLGDTMANYYSYREAILPFAPSLRLVVNGNDELWSNSDRVISDHRAGGAAVARWLLDRGRKRILRICSVDDSHYWVRDRNAGFEDACAQRGITPLPAVMVRGLIRSADVTEDHFGVRIRQMAGFLIEHFRIDQKPDAIAALSDTEAYYIAGALRLMGIEPGRDVMIAGYDNFWERTPESQWEPSHPAVTVDKLNHRVGEEMIQLLIDRAAGRLPAAPQLRSVVPRLVELGA